jgi:large subunit ribosomal protein L15e
MGVTKYTPQKSRRWISEERVAKKYPNLRVLNSYWVGSDHKWVWHEVILADPNHPVIYNDSRINWICDPVQKGRESRGLTSAGNLIPKNHLKHLLIELRLEHTLESLRFQRE